MKSSKLTILHEGLIDLTGLGFVGGADDKAGEGPGGGIKVTNTCSSDGGGGGGYGGVGGAGQDSSSSYLGPGAGGSCCLTWL